MESVDGSSAPRSVVCPPPLDAHSPKVDPRPGGPFEVTMRSPDGNDMQCAGVFLVVEPFHRLVWTDALIEGFRPSLSPFFTAELTLQEADEETIYRVIAKHKDSETRQQHEKMGFYTGWGQCLDQLVAVMKQQ